MGELVETGDLSLERGIAEQCAQRCATFLDSLELLRTQALDLVRIDGLGHLPSGVALARKFEQKASGGEYPLDQALADHIAVVEQMRAVFEKIAANYETTEQSNTHAISAIDPGR
ncbi:hypothetical protein [Rhodococcus sp. SGAir0479]|uniref:hypothetical protein n=1 Tax=Rhodococcus sp. SGAir0479 TaxID=2567884 RepID=UPI0020C781EC|nr:hypothetical protein [Rhodococcus sp. SGAir0479]